MSEIADDARTCLAHFAATIKCDEWETRQRIDRLTDLDGEDYDRAYAEEWRAHFERTRPLQRQHDELLRLLVNRAACEAPEPILVRGQDDQ